MWLIVGLGNPGLRYRYSRHNIGFIVIDSLAQELRIKLKRNNKIPACIGTGKIQEEDIILLKPLTYMNRSGTAVKKIMDFYKIDTEKTFVLLDDIDLPWRKTRIRKEGSSGGHKGLQSVSDELEAKNFPRLRLGIGRAVSDAKGVVGHVLGSFNGEERKELKEYISQAVDAVLTVVESGFERAMSKYN